MSLEGNVKNIGSVIYPGRLFCAGDSKYYITGYSLSGGSRPMIVYLASGLTGGYYSTIVGTDSGESVCIERIDGDLYLISRELQTENYVPCVTIRKIVQQSASVAVLSAPITLHSDPNVMSNRVIDAYVVGDFLYVQAGDGTLLKVDKFFKEVSKINLAMIANLPTDSVYGLCVTETEFYAWLAKTNVIVLIKKATIPAISPTGAFAYIKAKD